MEAIFSEFLNDYIVEEEPVLSNQSNEELND
jgi:hypothetical protein